MKTVVRKNGTVELVDGGESILLGKVFKRTVQISHRDGIVVVGYSYRDVWDSFDPSGRKVFSGAPTRRAAVATLSGDFEEVR